MTIAEMQATLRAGTLTALGLTRQYLVRIALIDPRGQQLNSVLELNPDAEEIAAELDRRAATAASAARFTGSRS